jgi:hypothetical protein
MANLDRPEVLWIVHHGTVLEVEISAFLHPAIPLVVVKTHSLDFRGLFCRHFRELHVHFSITTTPATSEVLSSQKASFSHEFEGVVELVFVDHEITLPCSEEKRTISENEKIFFAMAKKATRMESNDVEIRIMCDRIHGHFNHPPLSRGRAPFDLCRFVFEAHGFAGIHGVLDFVQRHDQDLTLVSSEVS